MTVGLEAMSVGRPVVVCDTPGMREDYFEEGITSFLVPTSDPEAMADRIGRLLDDRIAAAAMGSRAAMVARSRHSTGTMCAELRRIVGVAS
jgi:glycosyltransferase involved in cell wall biosynthesis